MPQVLYALREDPSSIFLLQDAGKRYDKCCQITVFGRNIVRPDFFQHYLSLTPYTDVSSKYHGTPTNVQLYLEDNDYHPTNNYVAIIDTEVEFRITPTVIRQLSREHMPAWGMKSYLDYFSDRKSGILLFLKVYITNKNISPEYLEKGGKGSSQIFKLYNKQENEVSLPVDIISPVISENKFSYLKDEILHLLKVENALIAQYDDTDYGLKTLQERVEAGRDIKGWKEQWNDRHLRWMQNDLSDDIDFDMAQLDYESIFREVLKICPGMSNIIQYARAIQPARLGEYDFYLKEIHSRSENQKLAMQRIFDMSLRAAIKYALYYYKSHNVDYEDVFQEACIGIMKAIQKHTDNVTSLFASYASLWMRQVVERDISPFDYNMRTPIHYRKRIVSIVNKLMELSGLEDFNNIESNELYHLLIKHTDLGSKKALQLFSVLDRAESIEEMVDNPDMETFLIDNQSLLEEIIRNETSDYIYNKLETLSKRERDVLSYRYGLNGRSENTLQEVGKIIGVTRERVRQNESHAIQKLLPLMLPIYWKNEE